MDNDKERTSTEEGLGNIVRDRIVKVCAESNEMSALLEGIANIIIDHFSDAFTLDLVEDDGTIHRYITRHVNHDAQIEIEELRTRFPLPATAAYGYPRVIKTGKSQFMPGVSPRLIHRLFANLDARMIVDGLSVRSFICVPLIAYGRTLGALTVLRSDRPNPFTSDDLLLIEDLAPIIAKCLDDRFSHAIGKAL